jgi:tetratricopeptide (TPR) repeat protein
MYQMAKNFDKTKEYADKLIDIKYKEPKIYTDMVRVSLQDKKDTTLALSYIEKGRTMFEDNMDLITSELDIYIVRKKTDVLKNKLNTALEVSPDNEILHFVLANLYKGTNQFADAEKEYLKAIEIRADYEPAVYNLGVLYYSAGKEWNDKLNALPMKDPKTKEYEAKSNEYFKKAAQYFENSYDMSTVKDKRTKQILRQLFLRLGETEKAEKYK